MNCLTGAILAYLYYYPYGRIGVLSSFPPLGKPKLGDNHYACFVGDYAIHYRANPPTYKRVCYKGEFAMTPIKQRS